MRTSPGFGVGFGTSCTCTTSGPPKRRATAARMRVAVLTAVVLMSNSYLTLYVLQRKVPWNRGNVESCTDGCHARACTVVGKEDATCRRPPNGAPRAERR